jgi:hypothetical protein
VGGDPGLLTITEAAARYERNPRYLQAAARRGTLPAERGSRGIYLVRGADVARLPRRRTNWSAREVGVLEGRLGKESTATIARRVGRSLEACRKKVRREGLDRFSGDGFYSGRETARALGVCEGTVRRWVLTGEISAERGARTSGGDLYIIEEEAICAFLRGRIERPRGRDRFSWRNIPGGFFRNYAERLAAGLPS